MPSPEQVDCDEASEKNQRTAVERVVQSFERKDRRTAGFVSVRLRRKIRGSQQWCSVLQQAKRIVSYARVD